MEETFTATSALYELPHPTVSNYFTVELIVLKEMSQALADLLDLRLPVSYKKQARQTAGYPLDQSHT